MSEPSQPDPYAAVWQMLDRSRLEAIVRTGNEPLFATISGAHLYGFASPNSDVDLRGAFILPASAFLGLGTPEETVSIAENSPGLELDWVAHDVRKFARMMTQDNGYVLEQLYSPLIVIGGDEHDRLKELGRGCVTRGLFRHYRGFAHGRRKLLGEANPTVKHLLYAYRVYLSGIRALRTGAIEANLLELNQEFRLSQVDELVARKRAGAEKMALGANEVEEHSRFLDQLESELGTAHDQSSLPEQATTRADLERFVVELRVERLRQNE
jgi:uncharacterized protein